MTDRPGRLTELDLFKSLLVVGMIAAHVLQLLSRSMPVWTDRFSEFINLVTFSGFLLAMGIGLGLARQRRRPWLPRLWPVLLLLLATYISSLAFALLVDREKLTAELIIDVLIARRLFGWSEFLASFTLLYAAVAVARPVLIWIGAHPAALIVATVLCLASTWIVFDEGWPFATLLGTRAYASFPLLPYLPWFLAGISLGRADGRITLWHAAAAVVGTGWMLWGLLDTGTLPERFPPTLSWIVGPALALLAYLLLSKLIAAWLSVPAWITVPGRHVLSFLLVSNLAIFTLRNLEGRPVLNVWTWAALTMLVLAVIGGAWVLWERQMTASRYAAPRSAV